MTVQSLASPVSVVRWFALREAVPALLLGLVVLGVLFRAEAMAAVQVWNDSTAYSHGFFVLPIALYLAWDRRHNLAGLRVEPLPWLSLMAAPLLLAWLAAERLGIMEGRQLVAITFVQLLFVAVLGWRIAWALSAALLYLYFLVPFGAFLTPWLQKFTLDFTLIGLQVAGIPFYADEFLIETPSGRYLVAEACAGLRFLIASIAFGALYACLIYRSMTRRAAFIVASIIIPIIANGFRALGIVVLGSVLGSAEAAATDHILYGWIFFSIVILLLILAGMPFRQDQEPLPPAVPQASPLPGAQWRAVLAAAVLLAFAGTGAAAAAWLDGRAVAVAAVTAPALHDAAGCTMAGPPKLTPAGSGQRTAQDFACSRLRLSVTMQVFARHANLNQIVATRRSLGRETGSDEVEIGSLAVPEIAGPGWRLAINNDPATMAATALWIDGQPSRGGLGERIVQARNSVAGAAAAAVLVAVELHFIRSPLSPQDRDQAQRLLAAFLAGQPSLSEQVAGVAAQAAGQDSKKE